TASDSNEGALHDRTASLKGVTTSHHAICEEGDDTQADHRSMGILVRALWASPPSCWQLEPISTRSCCKAPYPVDSASPPHQPSIPSLPRRLWSPMAKGCVGDGAMARRTGSS